MKILNRQAGHRYQLLEKFEAGIVLTGPEVKSVRQGHLQLSESFVRIKDGEAWLFNAHTGFLTPIFIPTRFLINKKNWIRNEPENFYYIKKSS